MNDRDTDRTEAIQQIAAILAAAYLLFTVTREREEVFRLTRAFLAVQFGADGVDRYSHYLPGQTLSGVAHQRFPAASRSLTTTSTLASSKRICDDPLPFAIQRRLLWLQIEAVGELAVVFRLFEPLGRYKGDYDCPAGGKI